MGQTSSKGITAQADRASPTSKGRQIVLVETMIQAAQSMSAAQLHSFPVGRDINGSHALQVDGHPSHRNRVIGVTSMATSFDRKATRLLDCDPECFRDLLGRKRDNTASRLDLLLLGVPDRQVSIPGVICGRG